MAEGYKEDVQAVPTPAAASASDNKFDGLGNPAQETIAQMNPTFGENDYPRETGHDSLPDAAVPLT